MFDLNYTDTRLLGVTLARSESVQNLANKILNEVVRSEILIMSLEYRYYCA